VNVDFRKDLLVHDAHRHPYIERLGAMYLMSLRYKGFGNRANSFWRQIFVLTLMPWLMKYHVNFEQRCEDSLKDQEAERRAIIEETRNIADITDEMVKNAKAVGTGLYDAGGEGVALVGVVGKAIAVDVPKQGLQRAGSAWELALPELPSREEKV
jgi:hypothetical protein